MTAFGWGSLACVLACIVTISRFFKRFDAVAEHRVRRHVDAALAERPRHPDEDYQLTAVERRQFKQILTGWIDDAEREETP